LVYIHIVGVWRELLIMIEEYAATFGEIHVTLGPVLDDNADGLVDKPNNIQWYEHV